MTAGAGVATDGTMALCLTLLAAGTVLGLSAGGRRYPGRRARLLLAGEGASCPAAVRRWPAWPWEQRHRSSRLRTVLGRVTGDRPEGPGGAGPAHHWWCLPAGVALAVTAESVLPLAASLVAMPLVARRLRVRHAAREAERTEGAVIELCASIAGELRTGCLPEAALLAVGAGSPLARCPSVAAAARYGGDVPAALREAAAVPGAAGLNGAAACWQVAADGGTGLAAGLDRVAGALRAERDQREDLRAQLAGPRSTAAVLALLPVFGLLLGSAMGAGPLQVLFHSSAGLVCLALGGVLEWAGLAWVAHLVRTAERGEGW